MQRSLLQRRCTELVAAKKFTELLQIANPFEPQSEFQLLSPKLSAMPTDTASKVATWSDLVFSKLVMDWLARGENGTQELLDFSRMAYRRLQTVSPIDLDQQTAKEFGDQKVVFRSIMALLCPSYDMEFQACCREVNNKKKNGWGALQRS